MIVTGLAALCSPDDFWGWQMAIGWIVKGTALGLILGGGVFWALGAARGFTAPVGLGLGLAGLVGYEIQLFLEIWRRR